MSTATATKPKTERTIVSMKLTATGVKTVLATSAEKQIENVLDLCRKLEEVQQYQHSASLACEGLLGILKGGVPKETK